ncbi:MAG TPA: hypothetical protein VLS89_04065 [Candidatus Nanopelagicales bacterium]|nr:hypothetical protein [Candidatus Nanopelagicales bacterium]
MAGSYAFASWGGDFFLFTGSSSGARISRYRPADGSLDLDYYPSMPFSAVGTDARTCILPGG